MIKLRITSATVSRACGCSTIVGINQFVQKCRKRERENDTYHRRSDGIHFAADRRLAGFLVQIPAAHRLGYSDGHFATLSILVSLQPHRFRYSGGYYALSQPVFVE